MKKLLSTLVLISAFTFVSCDVFDTKPFASLDSSTALVNGASANGLLLGAYDALQSDNYYGIEFVVNNDLIADNAVFQGFFDSQLEIDQKAVPFSNLWVNSAWVDIYYVVNITNELIAKVPTIEDPIFNNRDQVLGEAYAIRALAYFDLLRYFGEHYDLDSVYGIPLILEPIPDSDYNQIPPAARASVAATYDQILADLGEALPLLQGTSDAGRMNYWAALALRARINLYKKDFSAAFADADNVITNGPFSLESDLNSLYGTELTSESIFEVEFNDQDQNAYNSFLIRRDEYNVDPSLLAAFESGDNRATLYGFSRNADRCLKYSDPTNANNAKVLRLAEMYLIRAEAEVMDTNNPSSGLDDLNVIRNRAGLPNIDSVSSMEAFVDALLQERRIELSYEGHRFFDLVRYDRINSVLGITESFRKVFPIPRNELLVDEAGVLQQNPGYETL